MAGFPLDEPGPPGASGVGPRNGDTQNTPPAGIVAEDPFDVQSVPAEKEGGKGHH